MKTAKQKSLSVAFTGYGTSKILQSLKNPELFPKIQSKVFTAIDTLYKEGVTTFLSGMSAGFDMIAADAVLELKTMGCEVKFIAVLPFIGQHENYSKQDQVRYRNILENADEVIIISHYFHKRAYFDRNDYLLENSATLVCYYSGLRGGTMYTYNRAKKANMPIINIFDIVNGSSKG